MEQRTVGDKRLLEPGWAGVLTLDEALFIQRELKANPAGLAGQSGQLQDSCEANDSESTICPIHNTSRVETSKYYPNPLSEAKNRPNCPDVDEGRVANNGSVEVE